MTLNSRTFAPTVGNAASLVGLTAVLACAMQVFSHPVTAQEQAPNRREIALTAKNYQFSPNRIEVAQDDLVKVTVQSQDVAYSVTIDEYRVSRRVPAGGTTTLEFRADRPGTFAFYSNLTNDARHTEMKGELVVRGR